MPIYEYKCSNCDHKFEILHRSITKVEDVNCPKCKSAEIKKMLSTFSASFNGGGFANGYASSSPSSSCDTGGSGGGCCGGGSCSHN